MLQQIPKFIGETVQGALSVVGCRVGTEEPPYQADALIDGVEIRHYGRRIAAVTTVRDDREAALRVGFGRLARFIFGSNHHSEYSPASPGDRGGKKIAMTAPVAQTDGPNDSWDVQFYMPAKWTLEELPEPNDQNVRLVEVPAQTVAVKRFSGDRGSDAVARHTAQLFDALQATGFDADGEPTAWFYDPPWTIPWFRRNEIAIPIKP